MKLSKLEVREREDAMTKGELELARRVTNYYLSAWEDKVDRGLFDLWENIEGYWEGNPRNRRRDGGQGTDPESNVNFIHSNIEGQVAQLIEQNIAVSVRPSGPSDAPYAKTVETILEWIKEKNKIKRKLDIHERRREKFGTGIFRVLFDPDALGGIGLPVIEPCNPAYVFVDPNIMDVYKINEGAFIIETLSKPVSWAVEKFGADRARLIRPNFHPSSSYVFNEGSSGNYIHIMAWLREGGKLRLVQMSGCGVILSDSFQNGHDSFYANGRYPYFFTPLYTREGSVWAKGDAELLMPLQDLVDELDDQIRINARLSGNPQRLVDIASNIDIDKWTNESGLIIPTSNINGVKYLTPPDMPDYPLKRRETALNYERQMLTRFYDNSTGYKVQGVKTATEIKSLQNQEDMVIGHKKILLQETLSEVFEYALELIKEYYTEEQPFKVGEGEKFVWFRGSDLRAVPRLIGETTASGTKDATFDIEISVGAGTANNREFLFDVMSNAREDGTITPDEYRKYLADEVGVRV